VGYLASNEQSLAISKFCVGLFALALGAVVLGAPWLVRWLVGFSRAYLAGLEIFFFATIYVGAIPAAVMLFSLYRLLQNISQSKVFVAQNVELLRSISWSCFGGALLSFISTAYYFPWALIGIAAAFVGLIVRIVKNIMAQAVDLQDEVDQTV